MVIGRFPTKLQIFLGNFGPSLLIVFFFIRNTEKRTFQIIKSFRSFSDFLILGIVGL